MKQFLNTLKEIRKYPAAIFGLSVVSLLVISAIIVVIEIPYQEAIDTWRGGEEVYGRNPRNVPPKWYNWLRSDIEISSHYHEGYTLTEIVQMVSAAGLCINQANYLSGTIGELAEKIQHFLEVHNPLVLGLLFPFLSRIVVLDKFLGGKTMGSGFLLVASKNECR